MTEREIWITKTSDHLQGIAQRFKPETVVREKELGRFNFGGILPEMMAVVRFCQQIPSALLGHLTIGQLSKISDCLQQAIDSINAAREFHLGMPNTAVLHAKYTRQMQKSLNAAAEILMPYAFYGASRVAEVQELVRRGKEQVEELQTLSQNLEKETREKIAAVDKEIRKGVDESMVRIKQEADKALDKAQAQIAGVIEKREKAEIAATQQVEALEKRAEEILSTVVDETVGQQAEHFKVLAEKHEKSACCWCVATIAAAVLLAGFAVESIFLSDLDVVKNYPIQAGISKVLVFTVLGSALFFCARNYGAHRHNAVVNRHRENALRTFRVLAATTHSAENRDIVLNQAAQCIFGPRDSGYARGRNSGGDGISINANIPRFLGGKVGE